MFSPFVKFVRSIYQTEEFIPLHEPKFQGNEKKYVNDAIDSTFVSSVGEYVNRFEREFASKVGAKYAVATVNGTSALHLALLNSGVGMGDEVITQPLTFVATCNAISYCGAVPTFVDVDKETLGMSPESLKKFIKANCVGENGELVNKHTGRVIRSVLPMHTFGHPCRIKEIAEICDDYNLHLIEDCAESLGSSYEDTHTGNFGYVAAFSFNGNKVMTTGGGGMLVTFDEETAINLKHMSTTGKVPHKWEFNHDRLAFNYRMPNLNAALGCAQLENLDNFLISKRKLADRYKEFCDVSDIQFLSEPDSCKSNYWLNTVILKSEDEQQEFLKYTNENGVMTRPVWKLMYKLPMFSKAYRSDCSVAEELEKTVVNVPSSVI